MILFNIKIYINSVILIYFIILYIFTCNSSCLNVHGRVSSGEPRTKDLQSGAERSADKATAALSKGGRD